MTLIKKLTLKDVVEVLAIYDLEHCRFPHNYMSELYNDVPIIRGMAVGSKKLILLDREQNTEQMKETLIHELIHCKHFQLGDLKDTGNIVEKHVDKETALTYKLLYGHKL